MQPSILAMLGFTPLSCSEGVYRLRQMDGAAQFIGVLLLERPVDSDNVKFSLVTLPEPAGTPIDVVVQHWKSLDARRLVESGADKQELILSGDYAPRSGGVREFTRPDGERRRYVQTLATGEVACLN